MKEEIDRSKHSVTISGEEYIEMADAMRENKDLKQTFDSRLRQGIDHFITSISIITEFIVEKNLLDDVIEYSKGKGYKANRFPIPGTNRTFIDLKEIKS